MDYQQALDYLYQFVDVTASPTRASPAVNLVRTRALLDALGSPELRFPSVIVTGTKGKGSTCAMLESIARAAGLRVGLWTSPHLHTYRERIQVDRTPITEAELVALVERARPAVAALSAGELGSPATFTIGFALAMAHFADRAVDLAVLEVGLGGRYDSANVVTPLLSAITSVSYDHMEILGDTLGKIAWDKAGILKPGVPGLTVPQDPEAMASIAAVAREVGAPLLVADGGGRRHPGPRVAPGAPLLGGAEPAAAFDPYERYAGPHATALGGTFQLQNARAAVAAALILRERGLPIGDEAIGDGLAAARWPARFEVIPGAPPIVIDGAHNGDSCERLAESLRERFPGRPVALVFGASRGKDLGRMVPALAPAVARWVLTRSGHPRAMADLDDLRAQIQADPAAAPDSVAVEPDPGRALALARELAGPGGVVCVAGSLFVAAAARELLGLAEERDPQRA